jgi:transposase
MSDEIEELARRLVIGRKRDGRCIYDEQAKSELIEACRQPGASVSKLARACGVNANQLSAWLRRDDGRRAAAQLPSREVVDLTAPAFVPVHVEAAASRAEQEVACLNLQARLPNGVVVDLGGCDLNKASQLIEALGRLRCSASTRS